MFSLTECYPLQLNAMKHTTPDNRAMTRDLSQLTLDLAAATRQIDKLKKDNDDLTSQVWLFY